LVLLLVVAGRAAQQIGNEREIGGLALPDVDDLAVA
jgi:hypothetical protein